MGLWMIPTVNSCGGSSLLLQHHGLGEVVEEPLLHGGIHDPAQDEVQGEQECLPQGLNGRLVYIEAASIDVGDLDPHGHLPQGLAIGLLHEEPIDEVEDVPEAEVDEGYPVHHVASPDVGYKPEPGEGKPD